MSIVPTVDLRDGTSIPQLGYGTWRVSDDEVGEVPVVNQVELHPSFTQKDLESYGHHHGIVTEAWAPIGRGVDLSDPGICAVAQRDGRTPAQVILRWHLEQGRVVFPRSVSPQRMRENFDVLDFELGADELAWIDAVDDDNRLGPDPDVM